MPYIMMYSTIFLAATEALEAIQAKNYGIAERILIAAQCEAEELYLSAGEEIEKPTQEKPL